MMIRLCGTYVFHTAVRWIKLGEVNRECTLHSSITLVIFLPKILKLVKIWQGYDKYNLDYIFAGRGDISAGCGVFVGGVGSDSGSN